MQHLSPMIQYRGLVLAFVVRDELLVVSEQEMAYSDLDGLHAAFSRMAAGSP